MYTLHVAYLCDITGLLSNKFWEQETLAIVGSVYIRYFNLHIELQEQHDSPRSSPDADMFSHCSHQ